MKAPSFLMVLTGTSPYAYKRDDGVYVVPITTLKNWWLVPEGAFSSERVHEGAFFGYEGASGCIVSIIQSNAKLRLSIWYNRESCSFSCFPQKPHRQAIYRLYRRKIAPPEDRTIISLIPPLGRFLLPKIGYRLPFRVSFALWCYRLIVAISRLYYFFFCETTYTSSPSAIWFQA